MRNALVQDLVFIEEAFERMLLDYDRVFSAMGVPACLWRRTGEIYKGNREFSELVGVDGYMLRDVSMQFCVDMELTPTNHHLPLILNRADYVSMSSWQRSRL